MVRGFNGDGGVDLVVDTERDVGGGCNTGDTVSVLLGTGDSTFQAAQNFLAGRDVAFAAVGDFNRDGRLDLVTANFGNDTISVLINNTYNPISDLIALVNSLHLPDSSEISLGAKLQNAGATLNTGDVATACSLL